MPQHPTSFPPARRRPYVAPLGGRDGIWAILVSGVVVLAAMVPLAFNPDFYFYADTAEGAYGQWYELGEQLLAGHWPLLNPAAWMAGDYVAEGQWGLWNPLVLLIALFVHAMPNAVIASNVVKLALLAMASGGLYVLTRSYGAGKGWAALAAIAAPLGGFTLFMDATSWVTNLMVWVFFPWTLWTLRRYTSGRGLILWPAVFGYLLVTIGYVQGTIMLILLYLALLIEAVARRWWGVLLRTLLVGVAHGLVAITVYLPGVLTSDVTSRKQLTENDAFMVLTLSGLATGISPYSIGDLDGWWGRFTDLPLLYVAWFLPLLCLVSPLRARISLGRMGGLLIFGVLVLALALGPSQMGPLRFPVRSLPWIALVLIVTTAVLLDRAARRRPGGTSLAVMLTAVAFSGWLVYAAVPERWHWPRNATFLVLTGIGLTLVWLLLRRTNAPRKGTGRGPGRRGASAGGSRSSAARSGSSRAAAIAASSDTRTAAPRPRPHRHRAALALIPASVILLVLVTTVLQSRTYAPLVNSRADYPARAATYEDVLPEAEGDGIVVGDALSLPGGPRQETVFGNSWYLNPAKFQNVYTPVGYETYAEQNCVLFDGRTCPELLDKLFAVDETARIPLADLLSLDTVQILATKDRPISALEKLQPPAGWHVAERAAHSVTWVRDEPTPAAGTVVWSSQGTAVTQKQNGNLSSTFHVDSVGPEGGTVVLSRLAWPGYTVSGGTISGDPLRGYLLTVDVPAGSSGKDVTVTFRPPGWTIERGAVIGAAGIAVLGTLAQLVVGRRRTRRTAALAGSAAREPEQDHR